MVVHLEVQVRLADDTEEAEVLDPIDVPHNPDYLFAFGLQHLQVVAIHLRGELPLDPAHRLFHVVLNGLGKVPDHAGDLLQLPVHGSDPTPPYPDGRPDATGPWEGGARSIRC